MANVLQYRPFLIKPNNHELGDIFGTEIKGKEEAVYFAKQLKEKGAENVLVSMAGDGAVLVAEDGNVYQSEAPEGKVVNSVGAGDSMVAGFIAGYLEYGDYEKGVPDGSIYRKRIGIFQGIGDEKGSTYTDERKSGGILKKSLKNLCEIRTK